MGTTQGLHDKLSVLIEAVGQHLLLLITWNHWPWNVRDEENTGSKPMDKLVLFNWYMLVYGMRAVKLVVLHETDRE